MILSHVFKSFLICIALLFSTQTFARSMQPNPPKKWSMPFKSINYNLRSIKGKDRITLSLNYMQKRNIVPNLYDVIDLSPAEIKIFKEASDKNMPIQEIRCVDPKGCKLVIKQKTSALTLYGLDGKYEFTPSNSKRAPRGSLKVPMEQTY